MSSPTVDSLTQWGQLWPDSTEVRLVLDEDFATKCFSQTHGSLVTFYPKLNLLKRLEHPWPSSLNCLEMEPLRETATSVLGTSKLTELNVVNGDPLISILGCSLRMLQSCIRLRRHLVAVRSSVKLEEQGACTELEALTVETDQTKVGCLELKIEKKRHFLRYLDYIMTRVDGAIEVTTKKVKDMSGGELPDETAALLHSRLFPCEIEGVAPCCDKVAKISKLNGFVHVDGEVHRSCIPFGNRLFERLQRERKLKMIWDTLGTDNAADVHAFLSTIGQQTEDNGWVQIAMNVLHEHLQAKSIDPLEPAEHLQCQCPSCAMPVVLSGNEVYEDTRDGAQQQHTCITAWNPLEALKAALTPADELAVSEPSGSHQGATASNSTHELTPEDQEIALNALILNPRKKFRTIAAHATSLGGMKHNFTHDEVRNLWEDIQKKSRHTPLESQAICSRKAKPSQKSRPPISTPVRRSRNDLRPLVI